MSTLEQSYYELEKAKFYLGEMRSANSLTDFVEACKNYLSRLERVWNKFLAVYKTHSRWDSWDGNHIRIRKKDPLLSYLRNVRGADEHNVTEITENTLGGIGINPAVGNVLGPFNLSINKGNVSIQTNQPLKIIFIPDRVRLLL